MELTFLGTSSAVPSKHRNHPSIGLKAFGEVMLFDCGENTQRQLIFAKISPMKITKIFISHLHGDHILGLPGLIESMGFRGRKEPLNIYGPPGIFNVEIAIRNLGCNNKTFTTTFHEIKGGTVIDNDEYMIKAIKTKHNIYNLSYSIIEKKKPRFLKEKAIELGVNTVGCASTGNTSASLAAYAARGGLRSIVLLPAGKVALGKLAQAMFYGSEVFSVNGNFDQALESATKLANEKYIYLLNSINPFRLEGQKSIGFEIVDELGWESPDRIILPIGNAGNISAIWKGITEFYNADYIDEKPIMTGIQAEGAAPIVEAFKNKSYNINPVENPETVATAIRIGNPVSYIKALRAIYDSNGYVDSVTDEEILNAQKLLARVEGIGVEPASAASIAGLKKLVNEGIVDKGERIVAVVTGHVLKDPDVAIKASSKPIEVESDFNQLKVILEKK